MVEPKVPLFFSWGQDRQLQVSTYIKKLSTGAGDISIWYIVGGIIGGLLLFAIIAVVCYKVCTEAFSH